MFVHPLYPPSPTIIRDLHTIYLKLNLFHFELHFQSNFFFRLLITLYVKTNSSSLVIIATDSNFLNYADHKDTSFMFSFHSGPAVISQWRATLATSSTDDSFCSQQACKEMAEKLNHCFHLDLEELSLDHVASGQKMSQCQQLTCRQYN